jgi:hypothetical protein
MRCSLSQNAYPHARIESRQKPITIPGSAVSGLIVRTVKLAKPYFTNYAPDRGSESVFNSQLGPPL